MDQSKSVSGDSKPPAGTLQEQLEKIKDTIWRRRPILSEIMKKQGGKTLYDYSKDFMDINKSPVLDARKPELIAMAKALITMRLGEKVGDEVANQLSKYPLVSTTDHHGPIDHPFFVNANIISALPYAEHKDPDLKYLVVFSFASVSVNNASAYPRGIIFHGSKNGSGPVLRLPVLPDRLKMGVVYGTRSYTREDLTKAEMELSKKENSGELEKGRGGEIRDLMEESLGDKIVLAAQDLSTQITEVNYRLWPKLFHAPKSQGKSEDKVPDLIYLEIETLVRELFLEHHINNKESPLYKVLFTPEYRELALKYFNNLPGAFSLEKDWGTFFFWGVDEKAHRVRLKLNGSKLQSPQNLFNYEISPEDITKALREGKIFPSMLLCYLMVALYYGMKCLGGFSQVHDLTMIKESWGKLLKDMGHPDEAEAITPVQTKELGGDGLVLAYLKTSQGGIVPATGIDMVLDEGDTRYQTYSELSKKVTLIEMMNPMFPEIYTVLYPFNERDQSLALISPEEIMKTTGLQDKLMN